MHTNPLFLSSFFMVPEKSTKSPDTILTAEPKRVAGFLLFVLLDTFLSEEGAVNKSSSKALSAASCFSFTSSNIDSMSSLDTGLGLLICRFLQHKSYYY